MPTSIKLYHRCRMTKWAHLPVAGGWYDQHPQLIDEWDILLGMEQEKAEKERQEIIEKTRDTRAVNVRNV